MKCFHHPDADAVGICSACFKALCRQCAVDLSRGLACKDRCETEVKRMLDLRDFALAQPSVQRAALRMGKMAHMGAGALLLMVSAVLVAVGYADARMRTYMLVLAGMLILVGLWMMLAATRRPQVQQFRLCPHCGYNVTGNTTNQCPECGGRT